MLVVVDTNILISALIAPSGNEARIVTAVQNQVLSAAVSIDLLAEYEDVLTRPKFSFDPEEVTRLLHPFRFYSILVHPTHRLSISPDESDNRFLECAQAARAGFLITGNKRHFPVHHGKTKIVTVREFLETTRDQL